MKLPRKNQPAPAPTGAEVPTASDPKPAPENDGPSAAGEKAAGEKDTGPLDTGPSDTAPSDTAPSNTGPSDTGPSEPDTAKPSSPPDHQAGLTGKGRVRRTRVSALWIGLVAAAVLAIFLLIFIAQNSDDITIKFLAWEGQIPLAVAMLLASVVAILVVAVPGSLRIGQLRRALRKNAKG